jgi:glycogen(starch) synthase
MRVLHVLDISIPMLAGYTSRSRYLVDSQRALGLDPVVVTSPRHENPSGAELEHFGGTRYHRTTPVGGPIADHMRGTPVASEAAEIDHLRRRIVEVGRREKVDIVHGHSSILCGIPAWLASRQLGVPCVYEIRAFWEDAAVDHGTNVEGSPKYRAIQAAETRLAHGVDAVIGICEGIRGELIGRGVPADDVFVVPNGVEFEKFQPMARDEAVAARYGFTGKTVVGYIGTFAPFEGVPDLVRALVQLIRSGREDLRGLIVGDGPEYETCRRIAEEAGLLDRIAHPGRVSHDEVRPLYSVVDVLAYPRHRKRVTELVTPLKPLEAMAMEKAVIGSDVGGLRELIEHERTGLICRADDVDDLARTVVRLADDPELRARLGREGRAHVGDSRRWRRIVETHFDVYARARENWNRRPYLWRTLAATTVRLGL